MLQQDQGRMPGEMQSFSGEIEGSRDYIFRVTGTALSQGRIALKVK
jgi:hypothetical protein